ncbi:MAG: acyltransferase family protein [Microthrixaceae bacterium]
MDEGPDQLNPSHRPDVQGLRGIAILLVVVAHSGLALPGGFVGVDVFFVVSGFVIARSLAGELASTNRISFGDFYARRARRLLPSLALVTLVTLLASVLLLNPYLTQERTITTAGAASGFVANAYLYRHLGYFDSAADGVNPFLHLWSLSVEEQFYLFLPVTMLLAWRLGRRWWPRRRNATVAATMLALSAVSLALSWALTSGHSPIPLEAPVRMAFFSAPTRLWEFGVGVLLALGGARLAPRDPRVGAALGVLGAGLVVGTAVLLDPLAPFPGLRAVPPVLGTAALLVGAGASRHVAGALSRPTLRWVGDRSYTWYLWHWPAIVFAAVLWPTSRLAPVAAAVASLGVAAAVYRYLEHPVRRDRTIVGARALRLAAACVLVPMMVAGVALAGSRQGWGVAEPDGWYSVPEGKDEGCAIINRDAPNDWPGEACFSRPPGGSAGGTVLVLGDLAALAMGPAVQHAAHPRGLAVASWSRAGCPFLAASPRHYPRCEEFQRVAWRLIDQLDPAAVVIANRSTAYSTDEVLPRSWGANRIRTPDGRRTSNSADALNAWKAALSTTIDELDERRIPVVVVGPAPSFPNVFPRERLSVLRPSLDAPTRPTGEVRRSHAPVNAAERRAVDAHASAAYVDPVDALCDDVCPTKQDATWLYASGYDLTVDGSLRVGPALDQALDDALDAPAS